LVPVCVFVLVAGAALPASAAEFRRLPVAVYRDKMAGGWIGQMVGVGWGGPTEFHSQGQIMPEAKLPKWQPAMVNQFHQDDLYVELTFVRTLEQYGLEVPIRQAGIDFANSGYPLWHANHAGRDNLRSGIAPPDSGHPKFNAHADDIDYQIEADFSGLVAPGMPNVAIELGEKFGRLMNYGDGVYGGQFVGGMYAAAFFEDDPVKIVEAGLACIPAQSQYAECIRDVLAWYRDEPTTWEKTWQRIDAKYQRNPAYRRFSCDKGAFNIDAKINGAYIAMGLLYGQRDLEKTIVVSIRCGQDSDCNPSNAAGVLFTTVGRKRLPDRFTSAIDEKGVFSHTAYNFPKLLSACEKIAREAVVRSGGKIERTDAGEVFVIPVVAPRPGRLEQCWAPGPPADSRFDEAEQAKITALSERKQREVDLAKVAPGWTIANCGRDMDPGLKAEFRGKKNVFLTHPLDRDTGCTLSKKVEVPSGKKTTLRMVVSHHPEGDWTLVVRADGKELLRRQIGPETAPGGWATVSVDLSPYAGKTVQLELVNQPDGWRWEAAYWAEIAIRSE
jgi:hypothetical protein